MKYPGEKSGIFSLSIDRGERMELVDATISLSGGFVSSCEFSIKCKKPG